MQGNRLTSKTCGRFAKKNGKKLKKNIVQNYWLIMPVRGWRESSKIRDTISPTRAGLLSEMAKKSANREAGLRNRGPLEALNNTKLILND